MLEVKIFLYKVQNGNVKKEREKKDCIHHPNDNW